jgi:hypothetical protein
MATRRRSTPRRTSRSRKRTSGLPSFNIPPINPEVARSLVGLVLLVLGAVTLIALVLQGQGALT